MTRETNMAVGTRNGAGHGHLPLAGDRKTIETDTETVPTDCWQPARVGLFLPALLFWG